MAYKEKRQLTVHTDFPQLSSLNSMQAVHGSFSTKLPYANSMRTVFRGSLPDEPQIPTRPDHFFHPQTPPSATTRCCCTCCKGTEKQSAKTIMC
jgi:hypothetical protein